jgi:ATP-dependent Clp protease ATP-binding subunit ClpC
MIENYNLTPRAKKLIADAIKKAETLKHDTLEIEHLMYSFFLCNNSKALKLLNEMGFDVSSFLAFLNDTYFPSCIKNEDFKEVSIDLCLDLVLGQAKIFAENFKEEEICPNFIFCSILANSPIISESVLEVFSFDSSFFIDELNNYFRWETFSDQQDIQEEESKSSSVDLEKEFEGILENLNESCLSFDNKIINRESEVIKLESLLSRKDKNGVLIIGEEGVGKTSLVRYLAHRIITGLCCYRLKNHTIYSVNIANLVAGTQYRGQLEEKFKKILEAASNPDYILFIDDFHNVIGAGSLEGGRSDVAEMLKPYLSERKIRVIGATSFQDYKKNLFKNKSLCRRFESLNMGESSKSDTLDILRNKKSSYESHHNITIKDSILELVVNLSDTYLNTTNFPDKAIDLLDSSCANAVIAKTQRPKDLLQKSTDFSISLRDSKEPTFNISKLNQDQLEKFKELNDSFLNWSKKCESSKFQLLEKDIINCLSEKTGIPASKFSKNDSSKYSSLESKIKSKVFGQDHAIKIICNCLIRYKIGLKDKNKPIGSFLFLGQTGVGKTYISRVLSQEFFATQESFIKFDMSEYSDEASVNKLLGSSPGYIGHENGSLLVDKVIKTPHSVIVFDEIEKSHIKVQQVLLQILDEGKLTDSLGRVADFKNCIIVVTGNIGLSTLNKKSNLGFGKIDSFEEKKLESLNILKKELPLELLNRFDEIIFFNELKDQDYKDIIKNELKRFDSILDTKSDNFKNKIVYKNSVIDYIFGKIKAENKDFGAREVKRIIQKEVLDNISSYILKNEKKKYSVEFSEKNKTIKIV